MMNYLVYFYYSSIIKKTEVNACIGTKSSRHQNSTSS